ncbi:MAG: hypothetical protein J6M27_06655, partial [Lachnospiraceae bacterium]|nr:hypothetical protein [Lachnospiraceae bacterium]
GYLNAPVLAGFCGNWSVEAQYSAERMRSSQIVRTIRRVDRLAEKHREQDRNGEGTVTEMQTEGGTEE